MLIKSKWFAWLLVGSLMLGACASGTSTPVNYYVLVQPSHELVGVNSTDASNTKGLDAIGVVGISRLHIADYLNQSGLVMQQEEQKIHVAHFHRWAEPVDSAIARRLQSDLIQAMPELRVDNAYAGVHADWQYRVHIQLNEFNADNEGAAVVSGHWRIVDVSDGKVISSQPFLFRRPLNGSGYAALVVSLGDCLTRLSQSIERELSEIPQFNGAD